MDRLIQRIVLARSALTRLDELVAITTRTAVERDALVQRFEFSFEAVWKTAQRFLALKESLQIGSPAGVIRGCRDVGLLSDSEAEAALHALDDRNLTVHTYNEELAEEIASRIPAHATLLAVWLARIEQPNL